MLKSGQRSKYRSQRLCRDHPIVDEMHEGIPTQCQTIVREKRKEKKKRKRGKKKPTSRCTQSLTATSQRNYCSVIAATVPPPSTKRGAHVMLGKSEAYLRQRQETDEHDSACRSYIHRIQKAKSLKQPERGTEKCRGQLTQRFLNCNWWFHSKGAAACKKYEKIIQYCQCLTRAPGPCF